MTHASSLRRTPGLAEVVHPDRAVVLNLPRLEEQQSPYLFEAVAYEIWSRIDGTLTEAQIAAELAAAHGQDRATVAAAVEGFVAQLRELGLVEAASVPGSVEGAPLD
ncbi:PqqD family protein [Demequina iriomotensis]|uniref:PqqD family protein n=1 Tax=Demequina iriomotensis TaxID=1536641 RepID=UPI0007813B20|nr:PqqD family protein [Demequina iriomotensis]